jgi:hypothetical protein
VTSIVLLDLPWYAGVVGKHDGSGVRIASTPSGFPQRTPTDGHKMNGLNASSGFLFFGSARSLALVFFQVQLTNTYGLGCYLDQFIVLDKFQ